MRCSLCCLFHEGNTAPCINARSATLGKEIMMTTQILNPATMRPRAVAQVAAFDHNRQRALRDYLAAIDTLEHINEEEKLLSGAALAKHSEGNCHLRNELVEFITLYDQVAPYLEQARVAVQQDDDAAGTPDTAATTLITEATVELEPRSGITDWLRKVWAWIRAHFPRNSQYSKGQLPASDAVVDGTH